MRVAPWKLMAGVTVVLVVVGLVAAFGELGPVQLLAGGITVVLLAGGVYFGWRLGRRWAE